MFVEIQHTWVGDVVVSLTHVSRSAILIDRPGVPERGAGCGADDISTVLDDEALTPVENECGENPAIDGDHTPNNPLSVFDGDNAAGIWRLNVSDRFPGDNGALSGWCLGVNTAPFGDGVRNVARGLVPRKAFVIRGARKGRD